MIVIANFCHHIFSVNTILFWENSITWPLQIGKGLSNNRIPTIFVTVSSIKSRSVRCRRLAVSVFPVRNIITIILTAPSINRLTFNWKIQLQNLNPTIFTMIVWGAGNWVKLYPIEDQKKDYKIEILYISIVTEAELVVHYVGRILLDAMVPSYLIYLNGCECNVPKWISYTIKHDRTLHFEITSDVTCDEAFEPPDTLNVCYIYPLPPKPTGFVCTHSNFRNSNSSNRMELRFWIHYRIRIENTSNFLNRKSDIRFNCISAWP